MTTATREDCATRILLTQQAIEELQAANAQEQDALNARDPRSALAMARAHRALAGFPLSVLFDEDREHYQ